MPKRLIHKNIRALLSSQVRSQDGITLVDTAIILIVAGLLMVPLIHGFTLWKKQAAHKTTESNFATAAEALENFYYQNGHYPCPASPLLGPDSGDYGKPSVDAAGNCLILGSTDPDVVEGSLPFQALKMTAEESLDGWSNKITYAITRSLTQTPFDKTAGKVVIQDNRATCGVGGTPITNSNYHFVFLSHGEDGNGAYNAQGTLVNTCNAGGVVSPQSQNCDIDKAFTYNLCMTSDTRGPDYYDDMFYRNAGIYNDIPSKMWALGENPNDMGSRNVFVGVNTFDTEAELQVNGNIYAQPLPSNPDQKGNAHAEDYCESSLTSTKCFKAKMIAGDEASMKCNDQGMYGIGSNQGKCLDTLPPGAVSGVCAPPSYVIGIKPSGEVECKNTQTP